jgi:hypothetical protein
VQGAGAEGRVSRGLGEGKQTRAAGCVWQLLAGLAPATSDSACSKAALKQLAADHPFPAHQLFPITSSLL